MFPKDMFWIKIKKIRYTPTNPSFSIYKLGLLGYTFHGHVFLMYKVANNCPTSELFKETGELSFS